MMFALDLPDPDEAREWAEQELSKAIYREAEPTLFDKTAKAVADFIARLFTPNLAGGSLSPLWAAILVAIVLALVVLAFVIWGRPRGEHRIRETGSAAIFQDDASTAAELRALAEAATLRGEWNESIVFRFRAIARGLDERGVLRAPPGMTARVLARDAREFFPGEAGALERAADAFDDVRYLRRPGSAEAARLLTELDARIAAQAPARAARPVFA